MRVFVVDQSFKPQMPPIDLSIKVIYSAKQTITVKPKITSD